jgi:hypothetical protein
LFDLKQASIESGLLSVRLLLKHPPAYPLDSVTDDMETVCICGIWLRTGVRSDSYAGSTADIM